MLDALRDPTDGRLWAAVDARYRPVIAALARRLGLRDSDADEVAQQTLMEFVRAYGEGRYERSKGRLSSWILGIAHHTAQRMQRTRRQHAHGAGGMSEVPDESALRSIWVDERDRTILSQAMAILRSESASEDRTVLAFELVAMRGVPAAEAAAQCGMSTEQVYVAKSRTIKRLRALVEDMTKAFEEDA
jgi:RNA polymerase sigma factor (sigma-70 family)